MSFKQYYGSMMNDDYLAQWKMYKTSSIFPTEKLAVEFATTHWDRKDIG